MTAEEKEEEEEEEEEEQRPLMEPAETHPPIKCDKGQRPSNAGYLAARTSPAMTRWHDATFNSSSSSSSPALLPLLPLRTGKPWKIAILTFRQNRLVLSERKLT